MQRNNRLLSANEKFYKILMTYIIRIITILSVFNDGYSACAASFVEERKEQEDPRVLISNKISSFLHELGSGPFDFSTSSRPEEKGVIREIVNLRMEKKLLESINICVSLGERISPNVLHWMIQSVLDAGLSDQAIDLYILSALMLAKSATPTLPKQNPDRIFAGPAYSALLQGLHAVSSSPDIIPKFWEALSVRYFDAFPLLTRKACLLFPDNKENIEKLGSMIYQQKLDLDENGEEIVPGQHEMVAARLYRKAGTETSRYNIARLVQSGKINTDENGTIFAEKDRDKVAARVYRTFANGLSNTARQALANLASMIASGETDRDKNNKLIPKGKHQAVAARLYLESGLPVAMCNFAQMVSKHEIDFDENNQLISSHSVRNAVKARIYRKYQTPQALNNLALIIMNGETDRDEFNEIIQEGMRNVVIARLYRKSGMPFTQINLALMIIRNETDRDLEGALITDRFTSIMKLACTNGGESNYVKGCAYGLLSDSTSRDNALSEYEQAVEKGFSPALPVYAFLKKEIEKQRALETSAGLTEDALNPHTSADEESVDEARTDSEGDDFEEDDLDDERSVSSPSTSSNTSTSINASYSASSTEAWKQAVSAQRKARWQEKLRKASTLLPLPTLETTGKMIDSWDKSVVKGRLKLAELWDQRIINLVDAIKAGDTRLGAPEMLVGDYDGWMSRRISRKHRLVYKLDQNGIRIRECGGHYEEPIRQSSYVSSRIKALSVGKPVRKTPGS
jgi:toxin YoeB